MSGIVVEFHFICFLSCYIYNYRVARRWFIEIETSSVYNGKYNLGTVLYTIFLYLKKCQEALGPKVPEYHLAMIIVHTHS